MASGKPHGYRAYGLASTRPDPSVGRFVPHFVPQKVPRIPPGGMLELKYMSTFVPEKRSLSIPQTAERLGMCPRTVRRHIDAGDLPALRIGKTIRVPLDRLDAFLEEHGVYPATNRFMLKRHGEPIWEGSVLEAAEIIGRTPEEVEEMFGLGDLPTYDPESI